MPPRVRGFEAIQAGQVFWLERSNPNGREQQGRRPVVVVTDNRLTALGLCWIVPLSTINRGWPLHVPVEFQGTASVALCEQLQSISVGRLKRSAGSVTFPELLEIRSVLHKIIGN